MNRGLYTGPSVARASHVGRKTIRRFQIEQSRQEGALAGRSKKSILQLKSWKTYSHKRIPKKRWSPTTRLWKLGAYSQPWIHLAGNFIHISIFSAKSHCFPSSCYNHFICHFTYFWGPLICAISVLVTWNACLRFFLFSLASFYFPLGSFLSISLQSVTPAALLKTRSTDADLLPRAASICFEWMIHRQAPGDCISQIQKQLSRMKNWVSGW